jgi:cystathionine beta-lyase/cystathionine gamma-synthase
MKKPTLVNHPPDATPAADNHPLVAPVYTSVKFEFDSVEETRRAMRGERAGYFYQRVSNPTVRQLELTLAQLQEREDCVATATGVNAIAQALLALTQQGDHVVFFIESYSPTRSIIRRLLARFGVSHTMLSIEDHAGLEAALASRPTRLVLFESPTNPVLKVGDIERICALAHRHGALAVMDNTFAGLHQHGKYDVDLFIHSLTKYASGTGDLMGGAVIGRRELLKKMRPDYGLLGAALDPTSASQLQRGLKTYFVRFSAQSAAALRIATWLERHPAVQWVRYPGLASHPQHALAQKQMREYGTIVTCALRAGRDGATRAVDRLQLFALAASLGSTESLVMAPQIVDAHEFTPEQAALSGFAPGMLRLSIGLEDPGDLEADLDAAFAAL